MTGDILLKENLAGVIVLYNPDGSVINNIVSYIDSLSHLYVIDNSENPDNSLSTAICAISGKISYYAYAENMGIAAALNKGCDLAFQNKYDWILTMDQDSQFEGSDFFNEVFNRRYTDTAIIAASYNNLYINVRPSEYPSFIDVAFVITSGNILNLKIWQNIGQFIDKLFIDEVDNEFCVRAINNGFRILVSNKIYLKHKLGEGLKVKHFLTGKEIVLTRHSPIRVYYTVRNNLYIWRKFMFSNFGFVLNRVKNILYLVGKILLYFPDKKEYLHYISMGIIDALRGKYGKFKR